MSDSLASFVLQPFDIIQGAQSPVHPRVFVIGAFDSRITLYSQQVRALSLVHALRDQAILHDGLRIAVVGGGAAGVTAAAAVALLSNVTVDLYERADEVLPLPASVGDSTPIYIAGPRWAGTIRKPTFQFLIGPPARPVTFVEM